MTTHLLIFASFTLRHSALQALLENQPGISVIDFAGDLRQATDIQLPLPGVILADLLSVRPELVRQLRELQPDCGLLFLVDTYDLEEIVSLLQAGATGFISRNSKVPELARGIIAAGRGEIVLPQEMAAKALVALARGGSTNKGGSAALINREREVLSLLARGNTNKDIAQGLFLSVRTVEAHLRNIYAKLEVSSRTEAALWAVNNSYGETN